MQNRNAVKYELVRRDIQVMVQKRADLKSLPVLIVSDCRLVAVDD